jgi:hypothetical protein
MQRRIQAEAHGGGRAPGTITVRVSYGPPPEAEGIAPVLIMFGHPPHLREAETQMVHHVLRLVGQALCSYGVDEEDRVAILDASFVHFETMVKVGPGGARGATGNLSEHRVLHYDMCSPGGSHDPKVAMVQQAVFQGVGPGRVLEIAEAGFRIFVKLASAGGGKAVLPNPMVYVNGLLPGPGWVLATKFPTFTVTSTVIGDEGMVSRNLCQRLAEALLRVDACDVASCLAVGPLRTRINMHLATLEAALRVINFFQRYGRQFAPLLGGRLTLFNLEAEAATDARMGQGRTVGREWDIPSLQQVIAEVSPGPPMEMGDDEADLLLQRQRGRADEALLVDANWTLEAEGLFVHPDQTIRVRRYAGGGWRLELAWATVTMTEEAREGYCAVMAIEESELGSQNPRAFSLVWLFGALQGLLQHPQSREVLSASCIGALQETLELAEANLPGPSLPFPPEFPLVGRRWCASLGWITR